MARPIITLTTDYGTQDHLAGTMRGVILNINPDAEVVDITHGVRPYDILDGALAIGLSYRYFPPRTIHVVVVDPGVGTPRRPIVVSSDNHYFVAPDNGVLSVVYDIDPGFSAWHITSEHYFLQPLSRTFHGRDVFAPVAAWLTKTGQCEPFGEQVQDVVRFALPKPKPEGNQLKGIILRVDNFGNLLTNLSPADAPQIAETDAKFKIRTGSGEVTRMVATFGEGGPGEVVGVIGSSGYLEISINRGNAARTLGAQRGSEVTLELG
ncbi:MAG: SAM hydrolase/SAM-dependent halogenase family protein [Candidatus Acidiferrales bacterium]